MATVTSLQVETLTSLEELIGLESEWRQLEAQSGTDLPFQTWEWVTGWWSHLHEDGPGVRDMLQVRVVRDGDGQLVAVAPFMLTQRPGSGPIRARFLQLIGADPNLTEVRAVLCRPEFAADVYSAITRDLLAHAAEWDWVEWTGLPQRVAGSLDLRTSRPLEGTSAFVLTLAPTWPEFKSRLGRNIKESLRKCYNSLARAGLTPSLEVIEDPAEMEAALDVVYRLHQARSDLTETIRHADVFADPRSRAFIKQTCRELAERGVARVFHLRVDGTIVASRIAFVMGDTLYLYYSGWDPEYRPYSVMTTLIAEAIQYAISNGLRCVNLSTGRDVGKTRWGPSEVRYARAVQLAPRARAHATHSLYTRAYRLRTSPLARKMAPRLLRRRV